MYIRTLLLLLIAVLVTFNLTGCNRQLLHDVKEKLVGDTRFTANKQNDGTPLNQGLINEETVTNVNSGPSSLQQNISDYLKSLHISGSISVVKANDPIYEGGIGYANIANRLLNTPGTRYPIGSITKVFVATSIMQLQEQKKLNVQDPVSKYIPGFPHGNKIKLYHFLTHTSGINPPKWHNGDTTPLHLVREIEKLPLKFQPGTKWDYLDANYMVLGYIVEKVSGMSLHQYIQQHIIEKANLEQTGFIEDKHPLPFGTVGYSIKDGNLEPSRFYNSILLFGCGDIYSTPNDLSKFDRALMDGQLVSKNSLKQMLTPSRLSKYGLGLYYNGAAAYSLGVLSGFHTMHSFYNDNTSIVVFLNIKDSKAPINQIVSQLYQIVKDYQVRPASAPVPKSL